MRSRIRRFTVATALVALVVRAESERASPSANAAGAGAGPGSGFDPTGSHPLPNDSVDGRQSKSGCGCGVVGR